MGRREIDLNGSRLQRALRNAAAELTPGQRKRDARRGAFDRDFDRCPHGGEPGECRSRDDHYGDEDGAR